MAAEVIILSQKHYKQWVNDPSFSSDLANYTTNLVGLVMQKIKTVTQFRVENIVRSGVAPNYDPANLSWRITPITPVVSTAITIERLDGGNWLNEGFLVGDDASFQTTSKLFGNFGVVVTVSVISSDTLTVTAASPHSFPNDIINANIILITPIKSLIYKPNLIENNATFDNISLVTNEAQGWYSEDEIGTGSPRSTSFVDMVAMGTPNSWKNGSAKVRYVSGTGSQVFEVEHEYLIPFYRTQDFNDFFNLNLPPDYLLGNASLKYAVDVDFRTVLSNPNSSKKAILDKVLGSVGWYNEALDGFNNNYKINSVTYVDSLAASLDGITPNGTTTITTVIEKLNGNWGTDNVGVYFAYAPVSQSEVENTVTDFETNFIYDNIFAEIGAGSTVGTNVFKSCESTAATNLLTVVCEVSFVVAQQLKVNNTKKYILGYEVGDSNLTAEFSDQVMLKETNNFDDSTDIPDLMNFDITCYPYTQPISSGTGFTSFVGYNEHGLAFRGNFTLDLTKDAFLNALSVHLIAHNPTTNSFFELDSFDFNLPTLTMTNTNVYQLLDMATTRNYLLPTGDEKNQVSLEFDSSGTPPPSTMPNYFLNFAQKIRWEDWIKNTDANAIFWNNSKPNDNLNYKTSNYSDLNGYEIKMLFKFNVYGTSTLGISGNTDYRYFTSPYTIFDYNKDASEPPTFAGTIQTFTSDGLVDLGGAVQVGNDTLFKITWVWVGGALTDISNFWGIHRIQISGDLSQQIHELGSFEDNELTTNLLKPISGNYLTLSLVGGNFVTTCLIDGTKTHVGVNYDLSGEMASPTAPRGKIVPKILEDGTYKILEDNTIKTLES